MKLNSFFLFLGQVLPFYLAQDVKLYNDFLDLDDAYNSFLSYKNNTVTTDMWKKCLLDY